MKYVGLFAFKMRDQVVAMVQKQRGPTHLLGKWNGIGGKMEDRDNMSYRSAVIREMHEETGIVVPLDDLVHVEAQRFHIQRPSYHEVHWYACRVPDDTVLPRQNDAGEPLQWFLTDACDRHHPQLCPNLGYLVPKAVMMLDTHYLERPW